MAVYQFTNGASTTLNGSIDNAQTTLVVNSTLGFPTVAQFAIIIDSEIMLVTNVAGTTYTVTRASEATAGVQSPSAHNSGATVRHILTSGSLTGYVLSPVSGTLFAPTTLLTLNSIANNYGLAINGPAGAGTSFGVNVMAGTNSSDYAARFQTDALVDILRLRGDGAVLFGADSALSTLSGAGALTMYGAISVPPSAGGALPTTSYGTLPVKLNETLLVGNATVITFSSIPATFRHLTVHIYARTDRAATTDVVIMRFNNDSAANYDDQLLSGSGATATSSESLAQTSAQVAVAAGATATANYFGAYTVTILNYAGTTGNKITLASGAVFSANTTGTGFSQHLGAKWRTTGTAINRIDLLPALGTNFVAGSLFTLWGNP